MSEWIDINKEHPQMDFDVLVASGDDVIYAGFRVIDDGDYYFTDEHMNTVEGVTHWMPLPEPPNT